MADHYDVSCTCGAVQMRLSGAPRVRGHCHCNACRELLSVPYHSVTAWNPDQVEVQAAEGKLVSYQHPEFAMKKVFCSGCGDVLYNTNKMDWRVVSQHQLARSLGHLPEALSSLSHFHYAGRIVEIDDALPKKE